MDLTGLDRGRAEARRAGVAALGWIVLWIVAIACVGDRAQAAPTVGAGLAQLGYVGDGPIRVWSEPDYQQGYTATYGTRRFAVVDRYRDRITGEWHEAVVSDVTKFQLQEMDAARNDRFVIGGFDGPERDVLVLERWTLEREPETPARSIEHGGLALPAKRFVKTELFRGRLGVALRAVVFDANERYVLALVRDAHGVVTLFRFPNEPNAKPVAVAESTTLPELGAMRWMDKLQHRDLGRIVVCTSGDLAHNVVFTDMNNDGEFDGRPITGTMLELAKDVLNYEQTSALRGPGGR